MTVEELDFNLAGLETEYSSPIVPFDHFEFLELNGSLDWLVPAEKEAGEALAATNSISSIELDKLRSIVRKLNLEKAVPEVFWKLGTNDKVHASIPTLNGSHFNLGGICKIDPANLRKLSKVRGGLNSLPSNQQAEADQREGAGDVFAEGNYAFTFCEDVENERYWNLFLDTNGGHCIVESCGPVAHGPRHQFLDPEDEVGSTIRPGIENDLDVNDIRYLPYDEVEDLVLDATDLEEWLVNLNYTGRARSYFIEDVLGGNSVEPGRAKMLIGDIKHFLWNVYTNEGREDQLR